MERVVELASGLTVCVAQYGDASGFPVLWCHGGPGSRLEAAVGDRAATAAQVRLIAFDRPGIGRSGAADVATVAAWAPLAGAVLSELHIDQFAVAGWSAGGAYALGCGARLADRVTAIATVAGMTPTGGARGKELGSLLDRVLIPLSVARPNEAALLLLGFYLIPDPLIRWNLLALAGRRDAAALRALPPGEVTRFAREAWRQGPRGIVEDYRRFGCDWGFELDEVTAPVMVWQGDEDTVVPPEHADRLVAGISSSTLRAVPRCGHFLFHVEAEDILRELVAQSSAS